MSIAGTGAVIPVHGPIALARRLLDALVGPDVAASERPARVLVVDDASPVPVDPRDLPDGVELLRRGTNGGFGAAVNTGLRALAGGGAGDDDGPAAGGRAAVDGDAHDGAPAITHALVLNSDLRIPPGLCARLVADAAPFSPAIVGCRLLGDDGSSAHAARRFPTIGHQVVEWLVPLASQRHRDVLHRAVGHDLEADRSRGMVPVDWVVGALMLLPLREVLDLGGLDEGYFMYTEEVDLQLRARRAGIPSLLDADLAVQHAGGGSAGAEARRRRWLVGARMRFARRHGHVHTLRAAMTAASGANLVWNSGRRLAGRDVHPLAAAREELSLIHRAGRELPR